MSAVMGTGEISVKVVNGRREGLDPDTRLLVRAIDGEHKHLPPATVTGGAIRFTNLKVRNNFADRHTILIAARDHVDAGFTPVTITADRPVALELMLLRREAAFDFLPFEEIEKREALHSLLCGEAPGEARPLYEQLADSRDPALACLLNIATALEQMVLAPIDGLDQNPLQSFKALRGRPKPDRVFAWADARFLVQVEKTARAKGAHTLTRLAEAPAGLHPGATVSYKETDFGEGNVQLSFHEATTKTVNGASCMLVEVDIDYFRDSAAHILLEVFPNKLRSLVHGKHSAKALTDPRTVYGLRWMAGRRLGREFAPPYALN